MKWQFFPNTSKMFSKALILFYKIIYEYNQPANHPASLSKENPRYTQNRWWCLIELHSEMMQMLVNNVPSDSHYLQRRCEGELRLSWVWGCFAYSLHRAAAAGTTVWLWLRVSVLLSAQPRSRAYALSTNTMAEKLLNSYDINDEGNH